MDIQQIEGVVKNLVGAAEADLQALLIQAIPEAEAAAKQYLVNLESRGSSLLTTMADEDFQGDKVKYLIARIKDEKNILESEVFSFIIIGAALAQTIINSMQGLLIDAVYQILPSSGSV